MSLNAITDSRCIEMKLRKSEDYRKYMLFARHIAATSDMVVKTGDEFEDANNRLKSIKRSASKMKPTYYKSLRSLVKSASWRLIGSRMIYHEDKTTMYFLFSALGRKPEPKREQATLRVQVRPERKKKAFFGLF